VDLLRHWHPVCLARELADRPHKVWLAGQPYAVFRTPTGVGALPDACPHRGFPLSAGRMIEGALTCPYHGWSFDHTGAGRAPGTPSMRPHTPCLEAVERFGAVWLRRPGATGPFPQVGPGGFTPIRTTRHRVPAPLEAVVDNFTEVEHTGAVHWMLGYPEGALDALQVEVTATADSVRTFNRGPQRPLPRWLARLVNLAQDDDFIDDWTTRFSPVHTIFEQYWMAGDLRRPSTIRIGVVYTPVHDDVTDLYVFVHSNASRTGRFGLDGALQLMLAAFSEVEIRLDAALLTRLGQGPLKSVGRFDKALKLQRQRIERLYRGAP
jgi:phenylpropionate dioxygenase-like ring-hydroxylating dioxygenase large terminal subunit